MAIVTGETIGNSIDGNDALRDEESDELRSVRVKV